jgi:pyruvate carboxylase subunit B
MLPAAERLDAIGYRSLEVWGGATFDVCLRYLREDPWERLRSLHRAIRSTPLQMLLRGQNLVGYRHYADDVVERFVARAAAEGISLFRIFDALNDPRNMQTAIRAARKAGATAQGTICYTQSPVHTLPAFVTLGKTLAEMGADELCVKDMGGFLPPDAASSLVGALVREVGLPVVLHTHSSSGLSTLSSMAAAEAGATAYDSALSPFAGGASQPPTETLVRALQGSPQDPKLDLGALAELAEYFRGVLDRYLPLLNARSLQTDGGILLHQVPGGMLSNLLSQLAEQEASQRLPEVLEEIPRVRADLGYPPLVTPTSQIVGIQAVVNVLAGRRYASITKEVQEYVRGMYGTPPGPLDPELARKVRNGQPAVTVRPADLLSPELEKLAAELQSFVPAADEAELLSYAMFPAVYRQWRSLRDSGLGPGALTAAAVGFLAAVRTRESTAAPSSARPLPADRPHWAQAGRLRQLGQGGWTDASRAHHRR